MNNEKTTSTGASGSTLLFITFLVLKLTKVIDWSWWWVTAPLWMPIALVLIFLLILLLLGKSLDDL